MRIAFYAPLKPPDHPIASGDRNMARSLIAALQLAGHEVELASRFRSYDAGDPKRQARIRDVASKVAARLLRSYERTGKRPDAWFTYHLYHKAPDWLGPAVSTGLEIPYLVAEASFAPKQVGGRWDLGHRAVAEAVSQADRILQLNPADAECLLPLLANPDRLLSLAPFLDTAPYRALEREPSRAAVAAELGLAPDRAWLVVAAMMRDDQKMSSYRCLATALESLLDLPWSLIVAGGGPAEAEVRAAFKPLQDRVCWAGTLRQDALRRIYKAADLYVWPALKEAWGMALLEAQASGVPVVAGRSGGVPAVVEDGVSGLLPPEGDPVAFAGAMRALLGDPSLRQRMGRAAARRAAAGHDIRIAAARLDQALRSARRGLAR